MDIFSCSPTRTTNSTDSILNQAMLGAGNNGFTEGWLGVIGYDQRVFAAYYAWSYCFDHSTQLGTLYFSDTFDPQVKQNILSILDKHDVSHHDTHNSAQNKGLSSQNWSRSQSYDAYREAFKTLKDYILAGDCYQANLTQRFETEFSQDQAFLFDAFLHHANNSKASFCAYIAIDDHNTLLSFSPEQFISVNGARIETKPIKGTVKSTGAITPNQRERLLSEKNKAENLMIVDLLRNDLSKVATLNSVKVEHLFDIESYENVHHLVSTVSATLKSEHNAFEAFLSAFPGGSITGAPKKRAMEIIEELEIHSRRYYCGSIFYWDISGRFDSNILIRTVEHIDNNLYCWAGGGIVADSELESEYQESLDKVRHITGEL